MRSFELAIQVTRYGFIAKPYIPALGIDYNKVYVSIAALVWDFKLHGYTGVYVSGDMLVNDDS